MEIDPKLQRIDQKQKSIASEINTLIGDYKALKEENQHRTPKGDAIKLKLTQYQEMLAILDEARRETAIQVSAPATEALSTGAFKHVGSEEIEGFPSPQFGTPLTPETIKKDSQDVAKSLRAKAAESLLVPEEKVDVTSGLPFRDRVIMSIQPTVDEKNKFLLDKYPGSAIRNVDGSDMVFARVGDKYVLADEWGFGPGDLGDAVGGTTKTAANIGGAVLGVAAFRYHPIFASAIGANLSEQTIGGLLDMGGRKAADQPLNIGEIAARRAALGGIGVGVDLATGRLLAAPIAKRVGAVDEMEWKNGVRKAYDDFNEGIGIPGAIRPPVGVSRGIEKLTYQQYLAGKHPNSTNATFLEHNRKMAQKWMEVSMGEPVEPDDFVRIALDNYAQRYNALIDQVAKSDQKVANVLKGRVEREMRQFVDSDYRTEEIGKILTKRLREAEKAEADLESGLFTKNYNDADSAGFEVSRLELANSLRRKSMGAKGLNLDSPTVNSFIKELESAPKFAQEAKELTSLIVKTSNKYKEQYGGMQQWPEEAIMNIKNLFLRRNGLIQKTKPLTLADLHAARKDISDRLTETTTAAGTSSAIARQYYNYVNEIIEEKLPDGLKNSWKQINAKYQSDRLAFERSSPGAILATKLSAQVMTPTQVVNKSVSDIQYGRDILNAVALGDQIEIAAGGKGGGADLIRSQMQRAYLSKIGAMRTNLNPSRTPSKLDFDPEMVEFLWGVNYGGQPSKAHGLAMVKKLNGLNDLLAAKNLDAKSLTADDLNALSSTLSENQIKTINRSIVARIESEKRADELIKTGLIKQAVNGKWGDLNYSELATQLYKTGTITDLNKVMSKMPEPVKKRFRRDYLRRLFNNYRQDDPSGVMADLSWDGAALANDLAKDKQFKKRLEFVFGKDFVNMINSASIVMATSVKKNVPDVSQVRGTMGSELKPNFYIASGLQAVKDYWSSIIFGVKEGFSSNRIYKQIAESKAGSVLRRDVGRFNYYRNMELMLPRVLATQEGIGAMLETAEDDPRAAAAFQYLYRQISTSKREGADTNLQLKKAKETSGVEMRN